MEPQNFFFFDRATLLAESSFPNQDRTWALAVKALSPNHWTAREFPRICISNKFAGNADAAGSQTTFEHHKHLDSAQDVWIAISTRPRTYVFHSFKYIQPLSQGLTCLYSALNTYLSNG